MSNEGFPQKRQKLGICEGIGGMNTRSCAFMPGTIKPNSILSNKANLFNSLASANRASNT